MATYGRARHKLEEKLAKLLAFNASSSAIFAEIEGLKSAVSTGSGVASVSWNASLGTFTMPKKTEIAWAVEISEIEKRNDEIAFEKAKKGKTKQWIPYLGIFMYVEDSTMITPEELSFNKLYQKRLFPVKASEADYDLTMVMAQVIRDGSEVISKWFIKVETSLFT